MARRSGRLRWLAFMALGAVWGSACGSEGSDESAVAGSGTGGGAGANGGAGAKSGGSAGMGTSNGGAVGTGASTATAGGAQTTGGSAAGGESGSGGSAEGGIGDAGGSAGQATGADAGAGGDVGVGGSAGDAGDAGAEGGTSSGTGGAPTGGMAGQSTCQLTATGPDYEPPALDRACDSADDCLVGVRLADCCGTQEAIAFNQSEKDAFDAYNAGCVDAAMCDCALEEPRAEDGSPLSDPNQAVAECIDNRCLARGPDNAGTCLEGQVCIDQTAEGACLDATGPQASGRCRVEGGLCAFCRCAAPDTPIATPGGERPIAELRVGDLVYSVDDTGIVVVPIERVNRTAVAHHQVVQVVLGDGTQLEVSAGHPTADGRTFADLSAGSRLDGAPVVSATLVPYQHAFTYDILPTSQTGAYFAGGVLIGSTLAGLR